jgi:hypothetical protein
MWICGLVSRGWVSASKPCLNPPPPPPPRALPTHLHLPEDHSGQGVDFFKKENVLIFTPLIKHFNAKGIIIVERGSMMKKSIIC